MRRFNHDDILTFADGVKILRKESGFEVQLRDSINSPEWPERVRMHLQDDLGQPVMIAKLPDNYFRYYVGIPDNESGLSLLKQDANTLPEPRM